MTRIWPVSLARPSALGRTALGAYTAYGAGARRRDAAFLWPSRTDVGETTHRPIGNDAVAPLFRIFQSTGQTACRRRFIQPFIEQDDRTRED